MGFNRFKPHPDLTSFIECYWVVRDDDHATKREKIIPDGFTELIFHFGDTYRTNINGEWVEHSKYLLAGQISSCFFLENTGRSGIAAIKFKPTALTQLFGIEMITYTDKVVDLDSIAIPGMTCLKEIVLPFQDELSLKCKL